MNFFLKFNFISQDDGSFCPISFDQALCWPRTKIDTTATQPCFAEFHGIKYDATGEYLLRARVGFWVSDWVLTMYNQFCRRFEIRSHVYIVKIACKYSHRYFCEERKLRILVITSWMEHSPLNYIEFKASSGEFILGLFTWDIRKNRVIKYKRHGIIPKKLIFRVNVKNS